MAFCSRNPYAKSCVRTYTNIPQTVTDALTTITIEGTPVVESGTSLNLNPSSISVNTSGLYHFSVDVTFTPSAGGDFVVQLYKDGIALPCAISTETVTADTTVTTHVETDLVLSSCCAVQPSITLVTSGVAGDIIHTCVGGLRLA